MIVLWFGLLGVSLWAAHWGAEQAAAVLKKARAQLRISAVAGGALVGLASASPEVGINLVSAMQGVGDIGLGVAFGSNVIAIPLMIATGYVATRKKDLPGHEGHARHREQKMIAVSEEAIIVHAVPNMLVVLLVGLLVLPPPWQGLQPIDAAIIGPAYLAYLANAAFRNRPDREDVSWDRKEVMLAVAGIVAIAVSTYLAVTATERIVEALSIPLIVGGLLVTAPVATLPEVFATWKVTRRGEVDAGITSTLGDNTVTMTLALVPPALVGLSLQDVPLTALSVAFAAFMPAYYAIAIKRTKNATGTAGFRRGQLYAFGGALLIYLVAALILGLQ